MYVNMKNSAILTKFTSEHEIELKRRDWMLFGVSCFVYSTVREF